MNDKVDRKEPWLCENCSCTGYGYSWNGWVKLPPGWFRCDLTINDEPYVAVACSEDCMRAVDKRLEQP